MQEYVQKAYEKLNSFRSFFSAEKNFVKSFLNYKQREKLFFHTLRKEKSTENIPRITFFRAINRLLIFFRERQNETFYIVLIEEKETLEQGTRGIL